MTHRKNSNLIPSIIIILLVGITFISTTSDSANLSASPSPSGFEKTEGPIIGDTCADSVRNGIGETCEEAEAEEPGPCLEEPERCTETGYREKWSVSKQRICEGSGCELQILETHGSCGNWCSERLCKNRAPDPDPCTDSPNCEDQGILIRYVNEKRRICSE